MPPKKPVRRNNKKKKGGTTGDSGSISGSSQPQPAVAANFLQQQQQQRADTIPNFRPTTTPPSPPDSDSGVTAGGLYGVYKRATQRFKDGLAALVPVKIFAQDRVQTMMDAVDYIVENEVSVHPVLLEDCRISLHFRKKYSKKMAEGGDVGHEYIILVLNYCLQSLKPLVPVVRRKASKEKAKKFSFCDLQLSDSDSKEEEEEEFAIPARVKQPKRPVEPTHEFTFQDLIQGNDRLQACAFLDSVERATATVSFAYKTIKWNMRYKNVNNPKEASCLMEDLMEAAVTTNFCIRQVQLMEEELKLDNPHLSTFYHIIACVCLVHVTDAMKDVAQACEKSVPKTDMIAFVGDVVESGFRNQSDPQNRVEKLTSDFCRKWTLPRHEIVKLVDTTLNLVHVEIQPDIIGQPAEIRSLMQSFGVTSHSWLRHMQFIGGDRSILNTHRMMQGLSNLLMTPLRGFILKDGFFGTLWDEQLRPARTIQGDMDQLLMGDVLPELLASCQAGLLSKQFPKMEELLPLFLSLKHYIANPTEPVPLSLSGVHAILTSILELQGHNDVATIGTAAKTAYNCFFYQLQEQLDSELPNSTIWRPNLESMMFAKFVPTCDDNVINERVEDHAYWNPCCASMFLTFLTYYINMDGGAVMIDSFAQLRMVLHLYNALRQQDLIEGDIPLLSSLDKYFERVQSVWEGDKPKRDNIIKRFWLAYGMRADVIKRIHEECRRFVLDPMYSPNANVLNTRDGNTSREMTECRSEHFSKSYRRICLGDFSGIVDRYGDFHTNIESVPAWQLNFGVRVKDTLDLMDDEEELLSWNLMAVGGCLNAFIYVLMERLGWKQSLDENVAKLSSGGRRMDGRRLDPRSFVASDAYKERFALVMIFANKLLGPLEFLETVDRHPVLLAARDCLVDYFTTLEPSKYEFLDVHGSQETVAAPIFNIP